VKFAILTIAVLVLTTLSATNLPSSPLQEPAASFQSDIEKLEAEFKELDEDDEDVVVDVSGDSESSGNIDIRVRKIESSFPRAGGAKTGGAQSADAG
jgi:hypothetical protein